MKNARLIWQTAVVRIDDVGAAWLEFSDPGACSRCASGSGCGAALFSRLFTRRDTRVPLPADESVAGGRVVRVGLDSRWLMMAAGAAYLLPVLTFVVAAAGADLVWPGSDPAALVSGLTFALAAVALARHPLKFLGNPRLTLVDLQPDLESAGAGGHLSGRDIYNRQPLRSPQKPNH